MNQATQPYEPEPKQRNFPRFSKKPDICCPQHGRGKIRRRRQQAPSFTVTSNEQHKYHYQRWVYVCGQKGCHWVALAYEENTWSEYGLRQRGQFTDCD